MQFQEELKYSKEHTWLLVEGNTGKIGITEFAQTELGEIVYVDLPGIGKSFKQNEVFGTVEAVKTVSDLYMPVSGKIIELNKKILQQPTLVNTSPYEDGWMIKIEITEPNETDILLDASNYSELTGGFKE